ncbi:MAG: hypothetical protein RL623_1130, partial [Actinomycetota bacterium]
QCAHCFEKTPAQPQLHMAEHRRSIAPDQFAAWPTASAASLPWVNSTLPSTTMKRHRQAEATKRHTHTA